MAAHGGTHEQGDGQALRPGPPIGLALAAAAVRLREAKSTSPSLDAQVLLAHALGVERSWLFAHDDHPLDAIEAGRCAELIARRAAGEPVAYLTGRREFYGLELEVDGRVLIPRPETELLVDLVLSHLRQFDGSPVDIADVGTGSGAIAVAIAANAPNAQIEAVDLCADALAVARRNVERLGLGRQIRLHQGDLLAPLTAPVDIVVANLPYVSRGDYAGLDPSIRDYEPRLALEAGPDGLDVIRRLLRQVPQGLKPGGLLLLEIGCDQGEATIELVGERLPGTGDVTLLQDGAGRDRVIRIVRDPCCEPPTR